MVQDKQVSILLRKIPKRLRDGFKVLCLQHDTDMTKEIRKFMQACLRHQSLPKENG